METSTTTTVPIIDLSCFDGSGSTNQNEKLRVAKELRQACSEVGFFYIEGHGCPAQVVDEAFASLKDLFNSDERKKLEARNSPLYRGYNSILTGAHSCTPEDKGALPDLKESFTLGAEVKPGAQDSPMHGPNQWPQSLPQFEPAMRSYWVHLLGCVAERLMRALALSLDLDETFFINQCDNPVAQMVLLRYPPQQVEATEARNRIGCGAHTDCGFLTILSQDAPGLEVMRKDGSWLEVAHKEGKFVVNLGDMAAYWTNDFYKSTTHRVGSSSTLRHSIPFFVNCNFDATVKCLEGCCGDHPKYPPTKAGAYILEKLGLMHIVDQ